MRLRDLSLNDTEDVLRRQGVSLQTGPFWINVRSTAGTFTDPFHKLYADYPVNPRIDLVDFHVSIDQTSWLRAIWRPQILFRHDGDGPFHPLPAAEAAVMLEWGLNWCISTHAHHFLVIHAAVVARGDDAVLMSAVSQSGKSTLAAALIHRGWRLLSDELALIDTDSGLVWPLCRPVSLKAESIGLINAFAADAELFGHARDAQKGDVALMRVPSASIERMGQPARVRWLIEPVYMDGIDSSLEPISGAEAITALADNAFNYGVLEATGFEVLAGLVANAKRFRYFYSDLDDAVSDFDQLWTNTVGKAA